MTDKPGAVAEAKDMLKWLETADGKDNFIRYRGDNDAPWGLFPDHITIVVEELLAKIKRLENQGMDVTNGKPSEWPRDNAGKVIRTPHENQVADKRIAQLSSESARLRKQLADARSEIESHETIMSDVLAEFPDYVDSTTWDEEDDPTGKYADRLTGFETLHAAAGEFRRVRKQLAEAADRIAYLEELTKKKQVCAITTYSDQMQGKGPSPYEEARGEVETLRTQLAAAKTLISQAMLTDGDVDMLVSVTDRITKAEAVVRAWANHKRTGSVSPRSDDIDVRYTYEQWGEILRVRRVHCDATNPKEGGNDVK